MIWLILWLAFVVFSFRRMFIGDMRPESAIEYLIMGFLYLVLMGTTAGVCVGVAFGIGQLFPSAPVEGEHQILAAIRDKDGASGQFFLGSGFVESKPYYFFYRKVAGGGLRPAKLDADDSVTVYQQARDDAELVTFDWDISYPDWAWLISLPHSDSGAKSYSFYVPQGTVKAGYSM